MDVDRSIIRSETRTGQIQLKSGNRAKKLQGNLVIDGIVARRKAHAYIVGTNVLGLFFLSHINDPNAARDNVMTLFGVR